VPCPLLQRRLNLAVKQRPDGDLAASQPSDHLAMIGWPDLIIELPQGIKPSRVFFCPQLGTRALRPHLASTVQWTVHTLRPILGGTPPIRMGFSHKVRPSLVGASLSRRDSSPCHSPAMLGQFSPNHGPPNRPQRDLTYRRSLTWPTKSYLLQVLSDLFQIAERHSTIGVTPRYGFTIWTELR